MMNMYEVVMLMIWDMNACLTPRGVTPIFVSRMDGDEMTPFSVWLTRDGIDPFCVWLKG
jgi:hypothetical protein